MELFNGFCGIGQICPRLPRYIGLIIAHLIDQVLKFTVKISGIEDFLYLKFRKAIHLVWERGGHDAIREGVRHMRFQEADKEHRMDVHGWE